jgi:tetratricopeptide (TPR) repeat protein
METRNAQLQTGDGSVTLAVIRKLTERQSHAEALAALSVIGNADLAESRELLYLIAVNQRGLNRITAAVATLEVLQHKHPRYSRVYEERGYCFAASNDTARAIEAFESAVNLNAALQSSWGMLAELHRVGGDSKQATIAAEQVALLARLPARIVQAGSLFSDGELDVAEEVLRDFLREVGVHVEALRLLGRIAHQRNALDDAEKLLSEVLTRAPNYRAARADLARVLIDRQKYSHAREQIDGLVQQEPDNPDYMALGATISAGLADHEPAIESFRKLLDAKPAWTHLHLLLGNSLKAVGRQPEAIQAYRAATAAGPDFGDAYWSLANLKTYRFACEEIERMRTYEAAPPTQVVDQYHLCFALGKAFEDLGEYAQSWQYYERGNALKRAGSRYQPRFTEINTQRQIEVCTADFFAARTGVGVPDPAPIFIVGLPRSGSTLIEQILASHSQVEGTGELDDIERVVGELQGPEADPGNPRYPGVLTQLRPDEFRRLGKRYLQDTRVHRRSHVADQGCAAHEGLAACEGRPFFIDKMPNNFRHLGLIHLILPKAKIIDVRREPVACCFSNLKQLFASGQSFTYDMESLGRYYRSYLELMRHWDHVLPGQVLRVQYEDVVEDVEGCVRRILEFCGLQFEPACVEFHKTARNVSTASSEQVRQPINRDGLEQWRRYEPWLGPLKDALGDAIVRYRDA